MKGADVVKVTTEITRECSKELKIYAIRKDMTQQEAAKEILEKVLSRKVKTNEVIEE
jgi:hypothetical protein